MRLLLSNVFIILFFSITAFADYDFNGTIILPVTVTNLPSGFQSIQFQIKVNNTGSTDYTGPIHVKPFLFATDLANADGKTQMGAVLDTMVVSNASILSKGSQVLNYSSNLPLLRSAGYELAAFINNDQSIPESNTLDDITDMVDLPGLQVTVAPPNGNEKFDITGLFDGDLSLDLGGVVDQVRTVLHGPQDSFEAPQLWARFMLADLTSKHIFTAPYIEYGDNHHDTCLNQPNVDKNWFAISYTSELDADGNAISVDYYNQAPCFEDTPPGEYTFIELLNSRDQVLESNIHNDLNARPITIQPFSRDTFSPEIWFVQSSTSKTITQKLSIHTNYMKKNSWNLTLPPSLPGLSADLNTGQLGGDASFGQDINLTLDPTGINNDQVSQLNIGSSFFPNVTQAFPIKFFHYLKGSLPVLTLPTSTTTVDVPKLPGKQTGTFVIRNDGSASMNWLATSEDSFLNLSKSSGSIAPHSEISLSFTIDSNKLGYSTFGQANIDLLTSTPDTYHVLNVVLNWL